jgi:hypothetical protein
MQENRFRHKLKTAEGVNQTLYPIIDPIEGTYAQLLNLANTGKLIPQQWYVMTDYETIWKDPISGVTKSAGMEGRILLLALNIYNFHDQVYSLMHPNDIIYYSIKELNDIFKCGFWASNSKGFIYRRIDQRYKIDCPFDFRKIYFTRYSLDINAFADYSVSNSYNKGSFVKYNSKFYIAKKNVPQNTDLTNKEFWFSIIASERTDTMFILNSSTFVMKGAGIINLPINGSYGYNITARKIKIEPYVTTDVNNNVVLQLNNIVLYTNIAAATVESNIYIGKNSFNLTFINKVQNVRIGAGCQNNVFERDFYNNIIGNNCRNNYFAEGCQDNVIGNNFQYNTVGRMIGNQIGNDFQENIISDDFNYNIIGHKFQKKTIKNGFQYKKIDSNLTEEKDFDSYVKLFDDNILINLSKGINNQIPETKYIIRFFDPIALNDTVNVLQ